MDAETFVSTSREEINTYFKEIAKFKDSKDLEDILVKIASYSARASFMAAQASKSNSPVVSKFLDTELDGFLNEVQFQFKVWSRIQSVMQYEFELSKGY